jgi:hypothetical protein
VVYGVSSVLLFYTLYVQKESGDKLTELGRISYDVHVVDIIMKFASSRKYEICRAEAGKLRDSLRINDI